MTATIDQAWLATQRMREMTRMLEQFAEVMTGRKGIQIILDAGVPRTDGRKKIWLRPPLELGVVVSHTRTFCSERDPDTSQMICPACAQQDRVLAVLFHEMAHIIFDSMDTMTDAERARIVADSLFERDMKPGSRADKLTKVINDYLGRNPGTTFIEAANIISPWMPMLVNALEDARVNTAMYRARAGTRSMFRAMSIEAFDKGTTLDDGTVRTWRDMDRDAQAIIGTYCVASDLDITTGWFDPEVEFALTDPALVASLSGVTNARSVGDVYRMAFPVLEHLRRLGFCKVPDEPEDDKEESDEQQQQPGAEGGLDNEPQAGDQGDDAEGQDPGDQGQAERGETDPSDASGEADQESEGTSDGADGAGEGDHEGDAEAGEEQSGGDAEGDDSAEADPAAGGDDPGDESDEMDDEPSGESGDDPGQHGDAGEPGDGQGGSEMAGDGVDSGESTGEPGGEGDQQSVHGDTVGEGRSVEERIEAAKEAIAVISGHDGPLGEEYGSNDASVVEYAIRQSEDFDAPSSTCKENRIHRFDDRADDRGRKMAWRPLDNSRWDHDQAQNRNVEWLTPSEGLIGRAVQKARIVFAANARGKREVNHRGGRVDAGRLATMKAGNNRVFTRANKPGKRDYFVAITLDVSGSTGASDIQAIATIKKMGFALGELLNRVGVDFVMYAHTGAGVRAATRGQVLINDVFVIKDLKERWGDDQKAALAGLSGSSYNLDGHQLEFLRKRCDKSGATDKIILFVTDGAMPAANFTDELRVLQREIDECRKRRYELVGIGVGTSSPERHGLPTVRVDSIDDLPLVIADLEKRLLKGG